MAAITVQEAADYLGMDSPAAGLADKLNAAIAAVGNACGPIDVVTVVRRVTVPTSGVVVLPVWPVVSVVSAVDSTNTAVAVSAAVVDVGGVVTSLPAGAYTLTWTAGRVTVPDDLRECVLVLCAHLWETRRGPTSARRGESGQVPGAAHLWPYRAQELAAPYIQLGFA